MNAAIPEGHVAFDTSLFVKLLDGTDFGLDLMKALLKEKVVCVRRPDNYRGGWVRSSV